MLLKNRQPAIEQAPSTPAKGFEHIDPAAIAVMSWLGASGVDYVLVGGVARAVRGESRATGPVSIVPAPYGRNLDRLARTLNAVHARERSHHELLGAATKGREAATKFKAETFLRPERWVLRCGDHELDIEGRPAGSPSYQELLYEAVRTVLAPGLSVEVAAPEDVEQYDHVRRTGAVTAMVVTRL
jgi:hypothetical protein